MRVLIDIDGDVKSIHDNVTNLDEWCFDGQAKQVVIDEVLSTLSLNQLGDFLYQAGKKVCVGGKIILIDVDSYEIARSYFLGHLDVIKYNALTYGSQDKPWNYRQNSLSMFDINTLLSARGFKILGLKSGDYRYIIEAERTN